MITYLEMAIRLATAAVLGSIVGLERQKHEWTAGLRTHMLVCMGSALMMLISAYGFQDIIGKKGYSFDPSRIAAQVVSGIGFLGAGTIMFLRQEVVRGLTTAAGLWTVAGVGLAVGCGLYIPAVAATIIVWVILAILKPLEKKFFSEKKFDGLKLVIEREQADLDRIEDILIAKKIRFNQISIAPAFEEDTDEVSIGFPKLSEKNKGMFSVVEELRRLKGVREVELVIV
ncbi:MAG TPA: MgtC/SapB family protein [Mucilaginibacter sp.]|nr:MgtC/SapB family protein [Mucilaginibacter sp.]